jgi:hypothetical protein
MPNARANGIDIHYHTRGAGEPLLLIGNERIDSLALDRKIDLLTEFADLRLCATGFTRGQFGCGK